MLPPSGACQSNLSRRLLKNSFAAATFSAIVARCRATIFSVAWSAMIAAISLSALLHLHKQHSLVTAFPSHPRSPCHYLSFITHVIINN